MYFENNKNYFEENNVKNLNIIESKSVKINIKDFIVVEKNTNRCDAITIKMISVRYTMLISIKILSKKYGIQKGMRVILIITKLAK